MLVVSTALPSAAWAATASAEQIASYTLSAELDPVRHQVKATGQIHFTNGSAKPVAELWFHLYPNAFAGPDTRFWTTGSGARRSRRAWTTRGQLEVQRLVAQGTESNLWQHADLSTPGYPDDSTDCRVPLTEPVQPGQTLVLEIAFTTQLPALVERMGWVETFHAVTQWYPKLAKLESDGTWVHFPYEALAEFYSDFGRYDMTLSVPSGWAVAAPGSCELNRNSAGARNQYHCEISDAHDFAWFAWDRFEHAGDRVGNIDVQVFYPPGHAHNAALELAEARFGLPLFQRAFGPYPHASLIIVHPPDVAAPAGGMEYPGLIVTGGPWYSQWTGLKSLSAVTLHELAHQWFYGVVATDEFHHPMLDEGITSWCEMFALTQRYQNGSAWSGFGMSVSARAVAEFMGSDGYLPGPLDRPASEFGSFAKLAHTVYARSTILLETLGNVYGQQRLLAALGHFSRAQRFKHPGPQQLVDAFEAEMGKEAATILQEALATDGWVDYQPLSLTNRVVRENEYEVTAIVQRRGTLRVPAQVWTYTQGGAVVAGSCDAKSDPCILRFITNAPGTAVLVDPERRIAIESRISNNMLRLEPSRRPSALTVRLTFLIQWLMGVLLP